jgi:hypothetical protein
VAWLFAEERWAEGPQSIKNSYAAMPNGQKGQKGLDGLEEKDLGLDARPRLK